MTGFHVAVLSPTPEVPVTTGAAVPDSVTGAGWCRGRRGRSQPKGHDNRYRQDAKCRISH